MDRRRLSSDGGKRREARRSLGVAWIPLFREAPEAKLEEALADCEILLLPAGTALLRPGEINQSVYIPLSGNIAAFLDTNLSPEAAIPIAAGECLGELSAIDGKPVSALVMALSDARLLKLPREVFWGRLMALPGVARNLMITLSERMRGSNERALKSQREQLELIHLRKELDFARQLQVSMLPLSRPMFPDRDEIEVCGFMEPASNIGGDLFDAFFVDDHHLFFCIGDVSGHGIAAALFMARSIGLLRILAMSTLQPEALLATLNERLCAGNDANLFITLFCGFLDVRSGELVYSNAGHCPPFLSASGLVGALAIPKGALIGAIPGLNYSAMRCELAPGDRLFCYTDGVTEAQNAAGEEFSEERCRVLLGQAYASPLSSLLDSLRREVAVFTGTELLADDCTMIALQRSSASHPA